MPAKLSCRTGQLSGAEYEISNEATIGSNENNSIVLYPKIVSGKHARIYYDPKQKCYFLEDLGSRNGTELDGSRIVQKEKLGPLHILTIAGEFDFIFHQLDPANKQSRQEARQPRPSVEADAGKTVFAEDFSLPKSLDARGAGVPGPEDETRKTRLEESSAPLPDIPHSLPPTESQDPGAGTVADVEHAEMPNFPEIEPRPSPKGPADEDKTVLDPPEGALPESPKTDRQFEIVVDKLAKSFKLKKAENLVGRTIECDIFIDDPSISRRHAMLSCTEQEVRVRDLGSKNHTFVDNARIDSESVVPPGKVVRFGEVDATIRAVEA